MKKLNSYIFALILTIHNKPIIASGVPNIINDDVISSITDLLSHQTSLENLGIGLSSSGLSSANVENLSKAIESITTLKKMNIDISGNSAVDDQAISALTLALKDNLESVELDLDGTNVSDSQFNSVITKIQSLPKVVEISLKIPETSSASANAKALTQIFSPSNTVNYPEIYTSDLLIGATPPQKKQTLIDYYIVLGLKGSVTLTGADATSKRNNLTSQALLEIANHGGSNGYLTSTLSYTSTGAKGRDIGKAPTTQMMPGSGSVSISSDLAQKLGNIFPIFSNLRSVTLTFIGGNGGYGNTSGNSSIVTSGGLPGNAISSQNAQQIASLLQTLTPINILTLNLYGGNGGKTGNKSSTPNPSDLIAGGMPIDLPQNAVYIMQSIKTLTNLTDLTLNFYGGNGGDGASAKVGGIGGNAIDSTSVNSLADAIKSLIKLTRLSLRFSGGNGGYASKSNGWTKTDYLVTSALTGEADYPYTYYRYDGITGTAPTPPFAATGLGIDGSSARVLATAIATLSTSLNLTLSLSKSINPQDQVAINSILSNIPVKTITYLNN